MTVGPLVSEICFTFVLAAFLLHRYGNFTQHHLLVTVSVFVAWYFSFIIIFILPLDVSTTAFRQCLHDSESHSSDHHLPWVENDTTGNVTVPPPILLPDGCHAPWSFVPEGVLQSLWRVVYWTSQALTWIILPLMQSYSTAGEFTVMGKLKRALIENAIYYGSYLLIFGVLLVYVALQPGISLDAGKLKVICITASNTWGLFLLVLLLGYGLVEVPRSCWNAGHRGHSLRYAYFKASKLSLEKSEAQDKLDDVLEEVQLAAGSVTHQHPLRKHLEVILSKVPSSTGAKGNGRGRHRAHPEIDALSGAAVTEKSLVRLHQQVIRALQQHGRTQCQWTTLVEKALALEDVARNEESPERRFRRSAPHDHPTGCAPTLEWYWRCCVRGWSLRILGAVLALLSAALVWSEMTFFVRQPILTLFGIFHRSAESSHDYVAIELMSIVTIGYLCVCAYYTVFRVRVLNYYYLAPQHQTDEYSLIFSGMLLCRLTPPMCLNFLGLIHLDTHVTSEAGRMETAYTEIMGHMDVISIIANGFNIYFPMLICVLCLATYLHVGSRLLHWLGFEQFLGDDDMTVDLVNEGRDLIKRERGRRQRVALGESRRRPQARSATARQDEPDLPTQPGSGTMTRSGSEESARTELLRGVEPLDYTEPSWERYQRPEPAWHRGEQPPRGLFDDV